MITLGDLGEFGFIDRVAKLISKHPDVIEGVGDDCAVVRAGDHVWLATADLSIQNIHFRWDKTTPQDLGWKAVSVSLSDIAAMGGVPRFAVATVAARPDMDADALAGVVQGMVAACESAGAALVGGDTTRSDGGLVLDTFVLGEAPGGRYITRAGAQPGDIIAVTGWPGRSAAGLHALEHGLEAPDELVKAHTRPQARLQAGQWLREQLGVHALIDVSDGIVQDAGHIAERSHCAIDIDNKTLPIHDLLRDYCGEHGLNANDLALTGGEDYELLVAYAPDAELPDQFSAVCNLPLTPIGRCAAGPAEVRVNGKRLSRGGYDHFR
ncbi:MAG: thiamine-phosphate kinase [Candidatus Hydrogenedentales bacterium]